MEERWICLENEEGEIFRFDKAELTMRLSKGWKIADDQEFFEEKKPLFEDVVGDDFEL